MARSEIHGLPTGMIHQLTQEKRLAMANDFLQGAGGESRLPRVLTRIEAIFNFVLPDSCLCLWLWDGDKQKVCRVFYRPGLEGHTSFPSVVDANTPLGRLITADDNPDTLVHVAPAEQMGKLSCPGTPRFAYMRMNTVGGIRLLLTICLPPQQDFDETHHQFVAILAQYSIQAIERVRLREEREVLVKISNLANQSSGRKEFLHKVVDIIRDAFYAGGCSILLYNRTRQKLVLGGTTGLINPETNEPIDYVEYDLGEGLTGWIGQRRQPVRLFDAHSKQEWLAVDPTGSLKVATKSAETSAGDPVGPRPFLGAPILLGPAERLVGVIRLHQKQYGTAFLTYDERLLAVVSDVLAPAIERWNITTEMERELDLQRSLFEIIEVMHSHDEPDPDSILKTIAQQAQQLFNAYGATVLIKEPDEDKLRVVQDVGHPQRIEEEIVLDFGRGLCGYAALHRKTIAVPNVRENPYYYEVFPEVRSEIATPILLGKECLGALAVDSNQENFFHPEDKRTIEILETFAKQAAIALHRARVLREREEWRQNFLRTTEILTASSVASGLAHELKNGLAQISALAQNLESVSAGKMNKSNLEKLVGIRKVSNDLYSLAMRLMDLSRAGKPNKRMVYLNEIIEDRMKLLEEFIREKDMKPVLRLDPELSKPMPGRGKGHPLLLDERQIQQVLTNLVLNAVDASHVKQPIEVSTQNTPEWASFSVRDFGRGITPEDKKRMFEMFFTTKPAGFGLGLAVVKILIEDNHRGKLDVETKIGRGTIITVQLPKQSIRKGGNKGE
ncbi:MAG: GAF domain-containing protein [Armatimonadota bacterium]|nr:GAF domain-containing protein [Armatimonadota bacterium]